MMNLLFSSTPMAIITLVFWAIVIILSLIVEFQTTELVSIWFGVGAIPSLICAFFEVSFAIQFVVFAVVSGLLVLVTRPLVKKFNQKSTIPTNADRLIDMTGVVISEIPADGKGKVSINYQEWSAISNSHICIKVGDEIVVKEIAGNKLVVELVSYEEIN